MAVSLNTIEVRAWMSNCISITSVDVIIYPCLILSQSQRAHGFKCNYTPAPPKVYWIHPEVCPSIRPSICRQGFRNVLIKLLAQFISYLAFTLMGWVSWPLFIFMFLAQFLALWWPNIWSKMGFPELFEKNHWLNSFHTWHLPLRGWVSWPLFIFLFLAPFLALWWSDIWPKMGFLELFEKTIGPIHFMPGIYPYWISLFTSIHFRVPSLICGPLVVKYFAENGVSGTFWKTYWPNSFHTWHLPLWDESLDPYSFSCS